MRIRSSHKTRATEPLRLLAQNLGISLDEAQRLSSMGKKERHKEIARLLAEKRTLLSKLAVIVPPSQETQAFVSKERELIQRNAKYRSNAHKPFQYVRIVKSLNTAKG